ncbi:unnamed protein product, partial [Symbiodinium microadriaticum]
STATEKGVIDSRKRALTMNLRLELRRKDMILEESSLARAQNWQSAAMDDSHSLLADSLSDFRHKFVAGSLTERAAGRGRMFDKTKDLLSVALLKSGESINKILVDAHEHPTKTATLSCLSPRDGDIHFREIQSRLLS